MQVRTVTSDFIFSAECDYAMLIEIATHKDYGAMSLQAVEKLANQKLNKVSNGNGRTGKGASNGVGNLDFAKLRTVLVQKLQDSAEQGAVFKEGNMQFEFECLPDLDISKAGANKGKTRKASAKLSGNYIVVKKGLKCTAESDPEKYAIWEHVWNCSSFEEFFTKAPKKGVTKTGRIITAASEIGWAVKSGWIRPVQQDAQ